MLIPSLPITALINYPDRQTEPATIRYATQDTIVRRTIRMDDGCHSITSRQEEQLYILWGIPATGPRPWCSNARS